MAQQNSLAPSLVLSILSILTPYSESTWTEAQSFALFSSAVRARKQNYAPLEAELIVFLTPVIKSSLALEQQRAGVVPTVPGSVH